MAGLLESGCAPEAKETMRSIQRLGIGLVAGLVFVCGWGNNGVNLRSTLGFTSVSAVYAKEAQVKNDSPAAAKRPKAAGAKAGGNAAATKAVASPAAQQLPNVGQQITPLAPFDSTFEPLVPGAAILPKYPNWQAGQAVSSAVSPDGNTLLVLTSGYNRIFNPLGTPHGGYINIDSTAYDYSGSEEYVFIYDIAKGRPLQKQVVTIPNSYSGIVFDPSGKAFYVSGGMGDYPFVNGKPGPVKSGTVFPGPGDDVHVFALSADGTTWAEQQELVMGHKTGLGLNATPTNQQIAVNNMIAVQPMAAGVGISSDGQRLAVANYYNDSLTLFTGGLGNWTKVTPDIDLRPGSSGSPVYLWDGGVVGIIDKRDSLRPAYSIAIAIHYAIELAQRYGAPWQSP